MRSSREIAAERGMTVGAREARRMLKRVGVRPEIEKGVVERGGSYSPAGGDADAIRSLSSPGVRGRGLVETPPARFSSPAAARACFSWSLSISPVLVVLRFTAFGWRPTTVP
jgi:hypothetical protein